MYEELTIIQWPDPRLKKISKPVEAFEPSLKELAARMFELMRAHRGVGLAAPQVGLNIRLFVANATGDPPDDKVYVNPELSLPEGEETAEEGCLSLPEIHCDVPRNRKVHMRAQDLEGRPFEEDAEGLLARIWQHENDHLNGVLILDRMGMVARMGYRKRLREMEERYAAAHPQPATKRSVGRGSR